MAPSQDDLSVYSPLDCYPYFNVQGTANPVKRGGWVRRRRDSNPDRAVSGRTGYPVTPRRRGTATDCEVAIPASCTAQTAMSLEVDRTKCVIERMRA